MSELMDWAELLSFETFPNYKNEFGPHTQAVVNCFETLETISWFSHVGAEREGRAEVRLDTWSDAIETIFQKAADRYDKSGQLRGPAELVAKYREHKSFKKWIDKAVAAAADRADYANYIPSYFEKAEVDFMKRYLAGYLENLLTEIIASDEHDCTYFRAQLSWFEAGHFPCGWVGEWPDGVARVF